VPTLSSLGSCQQSFVSEVYQDVDELIEAEHSRATWSRATMGVKAAIQFDNGLRLILRPYAEEGRISY